MVGQQRTESYVLNVKGQYVYTVRTHDFNIEQNNENQTL